MPRLVDFGYGSSASTPPLDEMWQAWHTVVAAVDLFDTLTTADLETFPTNSNGNPVSESPAR